jgi:hypothetical protein
MTVEATIQSLLDESLKLKQLDENQATKNAVAAEKAEKLDADQSAEDEPSNKKNMKVDQKEAEGGTSKKPNEATKGATAPEGMKAIEKVAEEQEVDMSADVEALFNGEEGLTEEFRQKAETIFEAAVTSRIKEEVARIEEALEARFEEQLQEAIEENVEGLVEHIDGYLNLMVEQWMENNAVALESGMKSDILESFVSGMKNLFEEHYIDVPEEKFDVLESMESEIQALNAKLDEAVAKNVELNQELNESKRTEIVAEACEGLSDLEAEKLQTLAEEISFEDTDSFAQKMQTIRENYFAKKTVKADATPSIITEETITEEKVVPAEMQAYVKTISTLIR